MKSVKLATLLCAFIGASLFAGGSTGGGNVVVCKDATTGKETIRLLDYYEGEILYDLVPELGTGKTESDMVTHVTDRLKSFDKKRAERYQKAADDFMANTRFVSNVTLPNINDHAYVPLEADCKIEQIAVQNISPFPQSKKFTIRKDFWTKLSMQDKAGLMLHEIVYEEALAIGHTNSKSARYFNSLISSSKFSKYTAAEYQDRLELIGFEKASGGGGTGGGFSWMEIKLPAAEANVPFSYDLRNFVINTDGSPITFRMTSGPGILLLSPHGILSGVPTAADVGINTLIVEVSNGKLSIQNQVQLEVKRAKQDFPRWHRDPVTLPATIEGKKFTEDVSDEVSNPDGDTFTFSKISGPAWLSISSDGTLSGTPAKSDIGVFTAVVRALSPSGTYAEASVVGKVDQAKPISKYVEEVQFRVGQETTFNWLSAFSMDLPDTGFSFSASNRPKFTGEYSFGGGEGMKFEANTTFTPAQADIGKYNVIMDVDTGTKILRAYYIVEVVK